MLSRTHWGLQVSAMGGLDVLVNNGKLFASVSTMLR